MNVALDHDTDWLTQRPLPELRDRTLDNVMTLPNNFCASGELEDPSTAKESLVVRMKGNRLLESSRGRSLLFRFANAQTSIPRPRGTGGGGSDSGRRLPNSVVTPTLSRRP